MNIHPKTISLIALLAGLGATGFLWNSRRHADLAPTLTQGTFQIRYESDATASTASVLGQQSKTSISADLKFEISGRWVIARVSEEAGGSWVAIHMEGVQAHLTSHGNSLDQPSQNLQRDLQKTFFAKISEDGAVQAVQFGTEWPGDSRDFARTILGLTEVVVPSQDSLEKGTWSVTQDVHGAHNLTEYHVLKSAGEAITVERKPVSATTDQSSSVIAATPVNMTGSMTCSIQRDGRVYEIKGETSSESSFAGSSLGTEKVAFELKRVDVTATPIDETTLQHQLANYKSQEPACRLSSLQLAPDQKQRYAVQALEGDTEASLLKNVTALRSEKTSESHETAKLSAHLLALFKLKPETCMEFAAALDACIVENPAFFPVVNALGGAAHVQAQAGLVEMIEKSGNDVNRLRQLVPTLAHAPFPVPESEAAVRNLLASKDSDIRGLGYLGLGMMAGNLRADHQDRANRIEDDLIGLLKSSSNASDSATLILAIGNIGNDRSFKVSKEYLASSNAMLRQCAVASLSKIRTDEVGKILVDRIQKDSEYTVRLQAAGQLRFQTMTDALEPQVLTLLSSLREPGLKVAIIQATAGKHVSVKFSTYVKSLEASDSNDDVKRAAQQVTFAS